MIWAKVRRTSSVAQNSDQGHRGKKKYPQLGRFRTVSPVWIDRRLRNDCWGSKEEVPYCFSRSSIKFLGHTDRKIDDFDPNWALPDCNPNLNSQMKWHSKVPCCFSRSYVKFQGRTGWQIDDLSPIWAFPEYNSKLILGLLWNDTHSFKQHGSCSLLFLEVEIQGHTGWKSIWISFEITRLVTAIKPLKFALLLYQIYQVSWNSQ